MRQKIDFHQYESRHSRYLKNVWVHIDGNQIKHFLVLLHCLAFILKVIDAELENSPLL
jgi:hypothetical protein